MSKATTDSKWRAWQEAAIRMSSMFDPFSQWPISRICTIEQLPNRVIVSIERTKPGRRDRIYRNSYTLELMNP